MSPKSRLFLGVAIFAGWLCGAAELAGQAAGSTPPTAGRSMPVAVGRPTPVGAGSYDPAGRRDPFVSLIVPKTNPAAPRVTTAPRPGAGLLGVSVSDVTLKGVVRSGTTFVAILEAPDGRTFLAKRADKLMDGVIKGIENGAVVFTERVEDAAGAVRQRDVRKALKSATVPGGQS